MNDFFREQQGAAVLKHGLIRRYPAAFASKTGKWAAGKRVVFLDGYAGAGVYGDGTPGSPVLAAETAEGLKNREIVGIYVEQDPDAFATLQGVMAKHPEHEAHLIHGDVADHLDQIMEIAGDSPLFAFLDPFGRGLPFELLTGKFLERSQRVSGQRRGAITEVLLNFSLAGLKRNAGHLTATSIDPVYQKARSTIIAQMDAWLGGDYWRTIWTRGGNDKLEQITRVYCQLLHEAAGGWSYWSVPVSDRWRGPDVYNLVFLTQHNDGFWLFHESLSLASEEFYQWCHEGMLDLEPLEAREAAWIAEIYTNVEGLLEQGGFTIGEKFGEVFGNTVPVAREKHVRAAIKQLYKEGKTTTKGAGDIPSMVVLPVGA